MGRDKALLRVPGNERVTFVERLIAVLTPYCGEVLLVARDERSAMGYSGLTGVRVVSDEVAGYGPLMGLYSGLKAIEASHALVAAVDMPFIQPVMVSFLLSQAVTEAMIVPVVNGIPQVLLAVYPRAILPVIEERMQQGRRDPRSLLDVVPVTYIDEAQLRRVDPQLRSFVSVNTPEELRQIL